jgi:arsenite methyltransferase
MSAGPTPYSAAQPQDVKACCASSYSSDVVSLLLGDSYHPGGVTLSRRLLDQLDVRAGDRLLDVAAGIGTTAMLAATGYDLQVDGVELSSANVGLATGAAAAQGLADLVRFHHGDAESLPLPDAGWDRVICECALCTFPDKATAVREMVRVLRPGGRVGITDVTADRNGLPRELTTLAARVACIADARTVGEYRELLSEGGLAVLTVEHHGDALDRMIRHIGARLELLRMIARPRLEAIGVDVERARPVLEAARDALRDGMLGYVLIVAEKR